MYYAIAVHTNSTTNDIVLARTTCIRQVLHEDEETDAGSESMSVTKESTNKSSSSATLLIELGIVMGGGEVDSIGLVEANSTSTIELIVEYSAGVVLVTGEGVCCCKNCVGVCGEVIINSSKSHSKHVLNENDIIGPEKLMLKM